jgi:hypothetical protein
VRFLCGLLQVPHQRSGVLSSSLCARVLKARYFKNLDIMHVGCSGRGFFTWQSIFHGRDLLKLGLIWRVGNGANIDVWNSNWIPRGGPKGH